MELEAACDPSERGAYAFPRRRGRARRPRDDPGRDATYPRPRVGRSPRASTTRWPTRRPPSAPSCRRPRAGDRRPVGRRVPEPATARAHVGRAGEGRRARPRARAAAAERRRRQLRAGGHCRRALRGVVSQLQAFAIAMTRPHSAVRSSRPRTSSPQRPWCAHAGFACRPPGGSCSRRCTRPTSRSPPTASPADLDVASVYRNLETLEQIGLVRHFHLGHGPGPTPGRRPAATSTCCATPAVR